MVPCDFVRNGITVLKIIKLYFEKFSETIQNELLADKKKKKVSFVVFKECDSKMRQVIREAFWRSYDEQGGFVAFGGV